MFGSCTPPSLGGEFCSSPPSGVGVLEGVDVGVGVFVGVGVSVCVEVSVGASLGVSVATVSNALSGKGRVSVELVERIRATAAALGYVPSQAGRALRL